METIEDVGGLYAAAQMSPMEEITKRLRDRMGLAPESDGTRPPAFAASNSTVSDVGQSAKSENGLTPEQKEIVTKMRARDAEVRRHEQAHASVGGQYAGAPSYTYQTGPDNKRYAIGGEVPIDVSPVKDDPEATIEKMEIVKAAALAPAEPSGADRRVAALAESIRAQATADLFKRRASEGQDQSNHPGLKNNLPFVSPTSEVKGQFSRKV